jgi:hypothetical protein
MTLPTLPLVAVAWDDAQSSSGDFVDPTSLDVVHCPKLVLTIGWLLRDDTIGVSVCNEFVEGIGYRGHTFVPRSLIQSVKTLKKPRKDA